MGERLAKMGAALVRPLERLASKGAQSVYDVTERFAGIESLFTGLGRILFWPVKLFGRLLSGLFGLMPESVRHWLKAPVRILRAVRRRLVKGFVWVAGALNLDVVVLRVARWTRPIWYPFAAVGGFFLAWVSTRRYKKLVWGLPVIIVVLLLAAIGGWTLFRGRGSFAAQYQVAVKQARERKDYERVRLFERKLAQLGVATELTDYRTAVALANDGELEQAYQRMQQLAPIDKPGYVQAHLWIIRQLAAEAIKLPADESQRLLKIHLAHVQRLGARGPELDIVRAIMLKKEQKFEQAAKLMEPLASRFLVAAIHRLDCNIVLNRLEDSRHDARLVRTHLEGQTRGGGSLEPWQASAWIKAEMLLNNVPRAYSLADQWYRMEPENKDARRALVDLSGRVFMQTIALPNPDIERLTSLFLQAAELAEDPRLLQRQFVMLYQLRPSLPLAQDVIDRVVSSPRTPAATLEAAGSMAAAVGDTARAKSYLQRAVEQDPGNSVAWNNYAWLVAHEPQGDLGDALAAVNKALEIQPDNIRYRETRGQVFIRMGRWRDAIEDLEVAANGVHNTRNIHQSLAKAYDALGDKQLARVHRQHAGIE
jgi:tetratricopeptide (TPR) repeat protein